MLVTVIDNTGEKDSTGGGVWGIKKDNCSAQISHDPYFEEGPFSLSTTGGIETRNIPVTTFYYTNASSESKTEVKDIAVTVTEPVIGETVDFSYNVTDGVTLGDEGSIRWYNNTDDNWVMQGEKFKEGKVYEVSFNITANEGYKLAAKNNGKIPDVNVTINGVKCNTDALDGYSAEDIIRAWYSFDELKPATQPTTQPITDPETTSATEATEPVTYTDSYFYLPSAGQESAGYTYKLVAVDLEGNSTHYNMAPSGQTIDGVAVYKAEIPSYEQLSRIYFLVYDGSTEVSQVNTGLDVAVGYIIGEDGHPVEVQPSTDAPTDPSTDAPTEPSTNAPTKPSGSIKSNDIGNFSLSGIKNKTYTVKALTQNIKLTDDDNNYTLIPKTDYLVSYTDNINVGTAYIIITAIGDYEGSIVKTFKITKADNPIKVTPVSKKVKLKTVRKKAVTVKGALKISKAKGKVSCKIQSAPKAIKKYLKINSKGVITINKWNAAKKGSYSVKVKVTAKGNNNYKSATKTVKAKIKIK